MEVTLALDTLREQFPEQLVLYAADLAKILGKSEKAIRQLISRDGLPFTVRAVGGRRCVDIFQVAQWFANCLDNPQELAPTPVGAKPKRAARKQEAKGNTQGKSGKKGAVQRSSIGSKLSEMRDARALAMLACRVADAAESAFLHEVAKHIAFPNAGRYDAPYVAVCERVTEGWVSGAVTTERQKCYLDDKFGAADFIRSFVAQATPNLLSVKVVIRQGRRVLFDGFSTDGMSWFVDANLIGLEI